MVKGTKKPAWVQEPDVVVIEGNIRLVASHGVRGWYGTAVTVADVAPWWPDDVWGATGAYPTAEEAIESIRAIQGEA